MSEYTTELEHLPEFIPDRDGRIRILWIEDNRTLIPRALRGLKKDYFYICLVQRPRDLKRILDVHDGRDTLKPNELLPTLPFDVYVTDFRLFNSDTSKPHPEDEGIGIKAPAAGFLYGLFTALRFPEWPQAVIPYSAYAAELGDVWRLAESVCPPSVLVATTLKTGKENTIHNDIPYLAAKMFREALVRALKSEKVLTRLDDINNLFNHMSESSLPANHEFKYLAGRRLCRVKVGALFFDSTQDGSVPYAVLRSELLDHIPPREQVEVSARKVAQQYWDWHKSKESQDVYEVVFDQIVRKQAIEYPEETLPNKEWLGVTGGDETKRQEHRIALLFLLIRLHCYFAVPEQLLSKLYETDESDGESSLDEVRAALKALIGQPSDYPLVFEGIVALFKELNDSEKRTLDLALDHLTSPTRIAPIERIERTLIRCVEPFPRPVTKVLTTIVVEGKIGRGLSRLLHEKRSTAIRDLIAGRFELVPLEAEMARRFAIEHLPEHCTWPVWLQR